MMGKAPFFVCHMRNDPSDLDDKVQCVSKVGFCLFSNTVNILENTRSEFLYPLYQAKTTSVTNRHSIQKMGNKNVFF